MPDRRRGFLGEMADRSEGTASFVMQFRARARRWGGIPGRASRALLCGVILLSSVVAGGFAHAQDEEASPAVGSDQLELAPPPDLALYEGQPVVEMVLVVDEQPPQPLHFEWAPLGQPFSAALARQALRELLRDGRFASLDALVEASAAGVRLRFVGKGRYVVRNVTITGDVLPAGEALEASGLSEGTEV